MYIIVCEHIIVCAPKIQKYKMNPSIDNLVEDFTKVITFKIITTIKNHYGSLDNFKKACSSSSNKDLKRFETNFHIDSKILQSLTRDNKGKRHLDEVLSRLDPNLLRYKHKFDWIYKSGKKFSKLSTFYIPFEQLDKLFALEDFPEESPFCTKSNFYSQRQHKLIDKFVIKYGAKPRKAYTKSEKFIRSVETRNISRIVESGPNDITDEEARILVDSLDI